MALDDARGRWINRATELQRVVGVFVKQFPRGPGRIALPSTFDSLREILADHIAAAANDVPKAGTALSSAVVPLVEALLNFETAETPSDEGGFFAAIEPLEAAAKKAVLTLSDDAAFSEKTVDEVIEDFHTDYKISLLASLTANSQLAHLLRRWVGAKSANANAGAFLHIGTQEFVSEGSAESLSMSILNAQISSGPTIWTPLGTVEDDAVPALFAMVYGQWLTYIFSTWEDV